MTLNDMEAELQAKKERKAEQARINGAKSNGPTTPEGKHRSSRNAIRHGMTANKHTVLEGESLHEYDEIRSAFIHALKPANLAELRIVEKIANHDWRLERHIMLETSLLNMRADLQLDEIQEKYQRMDGIGLIVLSWLENKTNSDCSDLLRRYMGTAQHQFNTMYEIFCKMKKARIAEAFAGDTFGHPPYEEPKFNTLLKSEIDEPSPSYDEQYKDVPPATEAAAPSKDPRPSGSGLEHKTPAAPQPRAQLNEPTTAAKPNPIPKRPAA